MYCGTLLLEWAVCWSAAAHAIRPLDAHRPNLLEAISYPACTIVSELLLWCIHPFCMLQNCHGSQGGTLRAPSQHAPISHLLRSRERRPRCCSTRRRSRRSHYQAAPPAEYDGSRPAVMSFTPNIVHSCLLGVPWPRAASGAVTQLSRRSAADGLDDARAFWRLSGWLKVC